MFDWFKKKKDDLTDKVQDYFKPAPKVRIRDVAREAYSGAKEAYGKIKSAGERTSTRAKQMSQGTFKLPTQPKKSTSSYRPFKPFTPSYQREQKPSTFNKFFTPSAPKSYTGKNWFKDVGRAKPSFKEKISGLSKFIPYAADQALTGAGDILFGKLPQSSKRDALRKPFMPQTKGEANIMRGLDIASLPGGIFKASVGNLSKLAKLKNSKEIIKQGKKMGFDLPKEVAEKVAKETDIKRATQILDDSIASRARTSFKPSKVQRGTNISDLIKNPLTIARGASSSSVNKGIVFELNQLESRLATANPMDKLRLKQDISDAKQILGDIQAGIITKADISDFKNTLKAEDKYVLPDLKVKAPSINIAGLSKDKGDFLTALETAKKKNLLKGETTKPLTIIQKTKRAKPKSTFDVTKIAKENVREYSKTLPENLKNKVLASRRFEDLKPRNVESFISHIDKNRKLDLVKRIKAKSISRKKTATKTRRGVLAMFKKEAQKKALIAKKEQQLKNLVGRKDTVKVSKSIKDPKLILKSKEAYKPKSLTSDKKLVISKQRLSEKNKTVKETDIKKALKTGLPQKGRTVFQDVFNPVRKLQKVKGVKTTDKSDPYLAETLFHGRVGSRVEELQDTVRKIDKGIAKSASKTLQKDVDDYLKALHAPERNAIHGKGAAGMTDEVSSEIIERTSKASNVKEIKETASVIKRLNDKTLDILLEGGLIKKELYSKLRNQYKNHIPLNRVMEDEDIVGYLTGAGRSVKGSGLKGAKGSDLEVADITTNIVSNLQEAIIRSEKNRYGQSVLKFANENKDTLGSLFKVESPKAIGKGFDDQILRAIKNEDDALLVMEKGIPKVVRISDPNLASVLRGVGVEKVPFMFRTAAAATRLYASLATRFNPDFPLSNVVRDVQEAMIYMGSKGGIKSAKELVKKMPSSAKDVIESLAGKNTPGAKLYNQMIKDGGTTGGLGLSTRKQVELDMNKIRKLNRSNPRKAANSFVNGIDNMNQVFEDSTRLSAYKDALRRGLSRPRAAQIAKESTINFNKKGRATPMINALYMFSNASIQGSTKMLKAMKNPKVASAVVASVATPTILFNEWNDQIDPEWRSKIKGHERAKALIIVSPHKDEKGDFEFIKIPVGWGIAPIKVLIDVADDMRQGKSSGKKGIIAIAKSITDSYNPIGGDSFIQKATPSLADPIVDVATNKTWYGGKLHPDVKSGEPKKDKFFKSLDKSFVGRQSIKATEWLFKKTGGSLDINPAGLKYVLESYGSGAGRFAGRVVNAVSGIGEDTPAQDLPFINRFYKEVPADKAKSAKYFEEKDEFLGEIKKIKKGTPKYEDKVRDFLMKSKDKSDYERRYKSMYYDGVSTVGISGKQDVELMKPTFNKTLKLWKNGKKSEVDKILKNMNKSELTSYKSAMSSWKSKNSSITKKSILESWDRKALKKHLESLPPIEQKRQGKYIEGLIKKMTPEERAKFKELMLK